MKAARKNCPFDPKELSRKQVMGQGSNKKKGCSARGRKMCDGWRQERVVATVSRSMELEGGEGSCLELILRKVRNLRGVLSRGVTNQFCI